VKLRKALTDFARVVAEEAERNSDFANRVAAALGMVERREAQARPGAVARSATAGQRPKNRRPPPVLDPIEIARQGEYALRLRLAVLSIEQLRDIVAEFGMDPGKLVIKWKTAERIIERIVETSMTRAQKGDAFRAEGKARGRSENIITEDEIDYRGYRLAPIRDGDAWRVQIRAATATNVPPANISMKHSDREDAIANAKQNVDLFLQGRL
jgi:hypothetical protein